MKQEYSDNANNYGLRLFRSPTLETVKMVERTIDKYSGEFKKTQLWHKLPRKVMWPTYLIILSYLEEINHTIISDNGVITYIWKPELAKRYLKNKNLQIKTSRKKSPD